MSTEENGVVSREKFELERKRRKSLEEDIQELKAARREDREIIDELVDTVQQLKQEVDALAGVGENEQTTAKKRRTALVVILKRKAERNGGQFAMDYNHVKDDLAAHNHGEIHDKQAFRDMKRIAERVGGVTYPVEHPVTGNEAVKIDLDQYHGLPSDYSDVSDAVSRTSDGAARSDQQIPRENASNQTT